MPGSGTGVKFRLILAKSRALGLAPSRSQLMDAMLPGSPELLTLGSASGSESQVPLKTTLSIPMSSSGIV